MEPCRPSPPPRISSTIIVSKSVGHSSGQSQWATAEMACATPSRILLLASSSPVKKKTNQWPRPHPIVSHEEKRRPYLGAGGRGWRPWRPASFRAAGTCPRASTSGGRRTVSVARPPAGARAADGARPTRSRPGTRRTLRRQQQENKNAVKMVALHTDWLHLKGGRACVHSERVRKISFFSLP